MFVYQLILRLLVTMCVYACCDPKILVWSPNHQDSSPTSHHFKKTQCRIATFDTKQQVAFMEKHGTTTEQHVFFLSFCCWCACGADVFFCFSHFLFCVVLLLPLLIYGESRHLSSQHWLESPEDFGQVSLEIQSFSRLPEMATLHSFDQLNILLMEEIPNNHLGWLKPLVNKGDKPPSLVVSRILSINEQ